MTQMSHAESVFFAALGKADPAERAAYLNETCGANAELGVDWLHSYVSEDKQTSFCIYDGPDPDSVRRAAEANGLPLDSITKVSVLDPHFYR